MHQHISYLLPIIHNDACLLFKLGYVCNDVKLRHKQHPQSATSANRLLLPLRYLVVTSATTLNYVTCCVTSATTLDYASSLVHRRRHREIVSIHTASTDIHTFATTLNYSKIFVLFEMTQNYVFIGLYAKTLSYATTPEVSATTLN